MPSGKESGKKRYLERMPQMRTPSYDLPSIVSYQTILGCPEMSEFLHMFLVEREITAVISNSVKS